MEDKYGNVVDQITIRAMSLASDFQTRVITERTMGVIADSSLLQKIAATGINVKSEIAQGWTFEQLEVIKFNMDALKKDSPLLAKTTDALGITNHETVDIFIKNGKKIIKSYQAKSGEKASRTAFMLADGKYSKENLVGPFDQFEKVNDLYDARIATGTLKAPEYQHAKGRYDQSINADGVASGGTTYQEAVDATNPDTARAMANGFKQDAILTDMHKSGFQAGKIGAAVAGGVSTVAGLCRLARGAGEPGEVVAKVAIDAAKGYATGYVTTALSKGIIHGTKAVAEKAAGAEFANAVGKTMTKSNAHVALAIGVVQCGKSMTSYLRGEIGSDELLTEVSGTAITGASSFYYGILGQAIIPIPIVGAFVGSTVGYFIGNMLHQSGLVSLGESEVARVSRERREHIESLCLTAIPLMRAHRLELEELLDANFRERKSILVDAFDNLESAMTNWDANSYCDGLVKINAAYGAALPFQTFEEFDDFMLDDNAVFVL